VLWAIEGTVAKPGTYSCVFPALQVVYAERVRRKVTLKSHLNRCRSACAEAVGAAAKFTVFTSAAGFETLCGGWRKRLKDTKDTHSVGVKCIFYRHKTRNCAVGFWEGSERYQRANVWNNSRTYVESQASFACSIILNSLDI
jgi:hypothetical protein